MGHDIFISYKNDNEGTNFAYRLKTDLEKHGYSVYFNPDAKHSSDFQQKLYDAIDDCKDFLLIVSNSCLAQLIAHENIDWVRNEILYAKSHNKHILPVLMNGVSMPKDYTVMPEELRFLPFIDAVTMPEDYECSPFDRLISTFESKPENNDVNRDTYNSNADYNVNLDFEKTLQRANNGDPAAMYKIANMYFFGFASENGDSVRNYSEAYKWLNMIINTPEANDYHNPAHSLIADMYYHGLVPREPQSYEKALGHHTYAERDIGFSARESAYMRSRGCGCVFDFEETVNHYLEAINNGDNVAVVGLANLYLDHGRFEEAAELFRKTSHIIPDAEYRLGMLYRNGLLGNPPKPDFFRAAYYFQHAINTGNCNADIYHELGRLYFMPTGDFPKDFATAARYFEEAAERGNKSAAYKLGLMYEYGYVEKDIEKAIKYHTMAVKRGSNLAAYHLALIYQQPEHRNYHKAFSYAELAARKGVMEGEFIYANMLFIGRGCEADPDKAYEFYVKSKEHGMPQADFMLERFYNNK
ncbi:MAG: toll/interleukin-1 receptor domain-containing protein [Clostridia bacterium]|nr:toll/interleukin-1 receptor domain-containing protein [Clostridia bacterium]